MASEFEEISIPFFVRNAVTVSVPLIAPEYVKTALPLLSVMALPDNLFAP